MKAVKFLMPFTVGALYNEGEVAGFDEATADDLIKRKIAEPVKDAKPAKGGKTPDPVDPATLDDAALDKLIADEKVTVAEGADRDAKIAAVLAARKK